MLEGGVTKKVKSISCDVDLTKIIKTLNIFNKLIMSYGCRILELISYFFFGFIFS